MRLTNILKYFFSEKIFKFWEKSNARKILAVVIFFITMILILFSNFSSQQVMLRTDEVAKRDIVSNISATIIDEKQTEELKKQAAVKVPENYQEDKYALANVQTDVRVFYSRLNEILFTNSEETENIDRVEAKGEIEDLLNALLLQQTINTSENINDLSKYLLNATADDLEKMEEATLVLINRAMGKTITEEAIEQVYTDISDQIDQLGFSSQAQEIIKIRIITALRPNMIFNKEATNKAIKEAQDMVEPVQKTIKIGEYIVRKGDRVTAEQISILEQLGIQRTKSYPVTLIGTAAFIFITFWLVIEFLRRYHKEVFQNDKLMLLIGLIIIIILLITRFLTVIEMGDRPELNTLTGYLAPVAAGSMLIAILIDSRLAYFLTMIMALYVGLLTGGNQLAFTIAAFVGGTVGVYRVSKLSQTSDLAISGLYIAGANIVTIITLSLVGGNITLQMTLIGVLMGFINGILSAVLMIGALPYLETAFSITSMIKLLELSNPNHELLKRLLLEAPGTYHHSLMVGNLAEATAESIDANPLLVRVGALYHDIGKIKRPEYFVENQRGFSDPHEKIAPALSALIITSHVREGIELAREAHLPQLVIDFISEHHGTGLAKYFYGRALEEDGEGNINEENFRYEGPKPQSKEVALVMLADSVEAAVRSLPNPSWDKIHDMVQKIIRDKLNDRQLEECDLTFKDLDVIANTFCKVLEGVYHKRIEYPDNIAQELSKRREINGNDDNKPAKQD